MPDYRAILRDNGVSVAQLSAGQFSAIVNAMHVAYSAGYSAGYWAAIDAPHYAHGLGA